MKQLLLHSLALLALWSAAFPSIASGQTPGQAARTTPRLDTILKLSQIRRDTFIWKHHGTHTLVTVVPNTDESARKMATAAVGCTADFDGKKRPTAKTTFATAAQQAFRSMRTMQATLQSDSFMHTIGLRSSSLRKAQENRNVSVSTAFLLAISREDDEDFHLIVGGQDSTFLFNCEISGLPKADAPAYAELKKVRNYVIRYMTANFCSSSGYLVFTPPLPISIKGSLFYDIDHKAGGIGPGALKPPTAWEIHPIRDLHFKSLPQNPR